MGNDMMLATQMYWTKKMAANVTKQFEQIDSNVNQIMKGIYETLKAIDEEATAAQAAHIQMDWSISNINVLQPQMHSLFNRIGRWKVSVCLVLIFSAWKFLLQSFILVTNGF
jgi:hypothetical protein